jgi:hypothetical protein
LKNHISYVVRPNGLRVSRLAGCAGLGPHYIPAPRRAYLRRLQAEGQVGFTRWLGAFLFYEDYIFDQISKNRLIHLLLYLLPVPSRTIARSLISPNRPFELVNQ